MKTHAELVSRVEELESAVKRIETVLAWTPTVKNPVVEHNFAVAREVGELAGLVFGVNVADVLSRSRPRHLVEARDAVWFVMRNTGMTSQRMESPFKKTRSGINYGVTRCKNLMETNAAYRAKVETLLKRYNEKCNLANSLSSVLPATA